MKKSKKWLIMLADSFIARAVAIFLFFLAIITGVKEFFLSSNDFISKYSVPYFILSIIISIIISAIFTFYLKGYKISESTNIDNMDNDDGVKSRLIDRIGNITSLDIHHIIHTVRIATELGADIVKIPFPNDELALQYIVKNSLVPIVVAGGGEILGDEELCNKTKLIMENGAKGVCYGRNIIKSQNPRHTISLLKSTLII